MTQVIGAAEVKGVGRGIQNVQVWRGEEVPLRPALCSLGETTHTGLEDHSTCPEVFGHPGVE